MVASRLDARSTHSTESILGSALELIVDIGYSAMSMRCLAKHLGLQAGSLYHHFENKAAVLEQVVENVIDRRFYSWQRAKPKRASNLERLKRFVDFHVRYQLAFGAEEKLVLTELRHLDQAQRATMAKELAKYVDEVEAIVTQCVSATGNMPDRRITAASLIALLDGAPSLKASSSISSDSHLVQVMYQFTLQMLNLDKNIKAVGQSLKIMPITVRPLSTTD